MAALAQFIAEHHDTIFDRYCELVYERVERYGRDHPDSFPANTHRMIDLLGAAAADPEADAIDEFVEMLSAQRLPTGFQLGDILAAMFLYSEVILPLVGKHVAARERMPLILDLERGISVVALRFARAFVELQVSVLEAQRQAVLELSTPVIKVWDGILALPLVGTIDSYRARQIMEELLRSVATQQAAIVLVDITGVPMVDTNVADHLIKTIRAAELLGTECLLVGIGPDLAQTLVGLGVDLRSITSCADMRQGLTLAFRRLGLDVAPRH